MRNKASTVVIIGAASLLAVFLGVYSATRPQADFAAVHKVAAALSACDKVIVRLVYREGSRPAATTTPVEITDLQTIRAVQSALDLDSARPFVRSGKLGTMCPIIEVEASNNGKRLLAFRIDADMITVENPSSRDSVDRIALKTIAGYRLLYEIGREGQAH